MKMNHQDSKIGQVYNVTDKKTHQKKIKFKLELFVASIRVRG